VTSCSDFLIVQKTLDGFFDAANKQTTAGQGCQIFLGAIYQNREIISKDLRIKHTKIFHFKARKICMKIHTPFGNPSADVGCTNASALKLWIFVTTISKVERQRAAVKACHEFVLQMLYKRVELKIGF
jgi:hypothetical protein